jgi:hypothetical protein
MVATELRSGRTLRLRNEELRALPQAPFAVGDNALVLAYYASAEMGCFLALEWEMPRYLIDLYAEFRCITNGNAVPDGNGLLNVLRLFGLSSITKEGKEAMRDLIMNQDSYSPEQWAAILNYCATDVDAVIRLWPLMEPMIRAQSPFALQYAMFRGDFVKSVALMERRGVPVDAELLATITTHRQELQLHLVTEVERQHNYGVYTGRSFSSRAFEAWLVRQRIEWPRTETGALQLDDDTFEIMENHFPAVAPLRMLRKSLSRLRKFELPVGPDGRNRFSISPFRTLTGRSQPPTSEFIFAQPKWLRRLIRPEPGRALAYIDWEQQEFGIVAALSEDTNMRSAYCSSDPYLKFAEMAGAVPPGATKESHPRERGMYKIVVLGTQFSMSEWGLRRSLNCSPALAHQLMVQHKRIFSTYWGWVDRVTTLAQLGGPLSTALGWRRDMQRGKFTSQSNYPAQANGAEMMRVASVLAMEAGIEVCCSIHDAFLIEAPLEEIDQAVAQMQACMAEASRIILSGFELRSEAEIIRYPNTYHVDADQAAVWDIITPFIEQLTPTTADRGGVSVLTPPPNIIQGYVYE